MRAWQEAWGKITEKRRLGMADFFELLKTRRSIRDFQDREVPTDLVREIIKDTCLAPSSGNGQPWKFIVINNRNKIRQLSDESKRNILSYIEKDPASFLKKYEAALRNQAFNVFYNAPCVVYIVGSREVRSLWVDCALAACYFMFSAAARGLGTCWVDLGSEIRSPEILKEIGLPAECRIVAPVALGYPKSIPSPSERKADILKMIV
jgi:nitroreductase